MILAIDPGDVQSAFVILDEQYNIIDKGLVPNEDLLKMCKTKTFNKVKRPINHLAIEMVASYGMSVGKNIFDTCVWIGRFVEAVKIPFSQIYRLQEKMNICHDSRAKDSNIRQALVDRFGIVGTKKSPGYFYGFKKDMWAAFATGCTYLDLK